MAKIKRKTNKGKRVDKQCRNHGSCPYCRHGRTHNSTKRIAESKMQMREAE